MAIAPGDEGAAVETEMDARLVARPKPSVRINLSEWLSKGIFLNAARNGEGSGGEHQGSLGTRHIGGPVRNGISLAVVIVISSDIDVVVTVATTIAFIEGGGVDHVLELRAFSNLAALTEVFGEQTFLGIEGGRNAWARTVPEGEVAAIEIGGAVC